MPIINKDFRVNNRTFSNQQYPEAAALHTGGFVVVWESDADQDGSTYGIFAQMYSANTTHSEGLFEGEFQVNTHTDSDQRYAHVTALAHLKVFVVTWSSRYQDGSSYGVYGQV